MTELRDRARADQQSEQPVSEQVKEKAHESVGQVQEAAGDLGSRARESVRSQVRDRSSQAGEQLAAASASLRQASASLRQSGEGAVVADGFEQVAEVGARVGRYLGDSDADRILDDVESFIRRRPWAAASGGLLVGLFASRLLKASSASRYPASKAPVQRRSVPKGSLQPAALASGSGV